MATQKSPYRRLISVSREFFEELEGYLRADERFTDSSRPNWPLILLTPAGKKIEFVCHQPRKEDTDAPCG